MRSISFKGTTGFALIESMMSVLLLSVGAIGIAISTATAIKINSDNQQRAMALNAASMALESLYTAANTDSIGTTLHADIAAYVPVVNGSSGYTVSIIPNGRGSCGANPASANCVWPNTYIVKVLEAVDTAGTNVLTTAPTVATPYLSPVTIAVQVDFQGLAGKNVGGVEEIKSFNASYTIVLN